MGKSYGGKSLTLPHAPANAGASSRANHSLNEREIMHNLKNIKQDLDAICNANGEHIAVAIGADSDSNETKKANAAHIVKCVNSHDALIAAIESLLDAPNDSASIQKALAALALAK